MARYTRVARQEFPSTAPDRQGKIDVAYVYMDEGMGTIMFQIPKEEDTEDRVLEELGKSAELAEGGGPKSVEI